ncbi:MAG: PEP-CTERM system histidine kinase PrsK [Proteobacteria bacterium]|nr:PEP-CTERM system histidine kinase PrsK [Pseudomonadota bacterium]
MLEPSLTLPLVGHAIAAAVYAAFAIYLLKHGYASRRGARVQQAMLGAVVLSLGWALAGVGDQLSPYTWPGYVAAGFDLARYAAWLIVLLLMLRPAGGGGASQPGPGGRSLPRASAWLTAALLAAAALALAERVRQGQYEPDASRNFLLVALGLPVMGLVLIEQIFRNLADALRWSAKPLCVGLGFIFVFDVYLYAEGALLGRIDPDVLAIRPLAHLLLIPLLALASWRRVDWVQTIQVSRRAVFYSATLLLAGGYLLFLALIGYYVRYFGGQWGRALQFGLLFAGGLTLVLLVLSASLRARVRVFIGKHFFSYRYDYREEWLAFTAMLSSDSSPQEVGVLVIRALANIVECPAGSLWTRADDGAYRQAAHWNTPEQANREPADSPLIGFLREKAWVIDVEVFRRAPADYGNLDLPPWLLANDHVWAVIPLHDGSELLGFVVLAPPRTPVDLNWEARDLLKTASRQAAGYLAQMRATEALLESRKFDAFNRMSAFVVHDLKNIVTQLSLMMKNAARLRDNPEFQEDMLLTVESSLEKMRRLMLQLREGVAPPGGVRGVELAGIVERLGHLAGQAGRRLDIELAEPLATRGHEDRLERVLGHLVQNALDATPPSGRVWVRVNRFGGQVRVEVGDTGQGMSEEFVRTRLFKPFSSTKHSGMGIGTYESAQYIRELGGSIEVDSQPGRGTTLTVLLPLFDSSRGSDLRAA